MKTPEYVDYVNAALTRPSLVIYSYTGRLVGPEHDVPSLQDISVALGRIARYAGASVKFWPVLLHSFVVADLLPPKLKIYGLLHDSTECIVSDIPRGFKPASVSAIEKVMFDRILESLKIPLPTEEDHKLIKIADNEALFGEVWTVGTAGLRDYYTERSKRAERLVMQYAKEFPPESCIHPDGMAVLEFISKYRDYFDLTNSFPSRKRNIQGGKQ